MLVVLFSVAAAQAATPEAEARATAARLTGAALAGGQSYATVSSLADRIGQRLTGSPGAARAVEWAVKAMKDAGLKNVRKEPVKVTPWLRGEASAEVLAPASVRLHAVALGGSVATPGTGVTAEVVEVESLDELKALGAKAKGKIVLYNKVMPRSRGFDGYGAVVPMRGRGAIEAAKLGAVAALIRSVGTGAYQLPHTGATRYDDKVEKIPFAAITAEDADQIHRLLASGEPVQLKLRLTCKRAPDVESANVVGEIVGREKPEEIVVIGAHLDSWDLGTGAIDDGAGCAIVLETARLITSLGLQPRRTVRVVLYMNEENGLSGARAYAETHKGELKNHVAAMEADAGAGRPLGFGVAGGPESVALVRKLAAPVMSLAPTVGVSDEAGADLIPLQMAGVPVLGINQDMSSYFDWHHTAADTVDKIDPVDLGLVVAAFSVMAHALAESPERLPPSPAPPRF